MNPKMKKKILQIFIAFFVVVLLLALGGIGKYYLDMSKDEESFAKLAQMNKIAEEREYSYEMLKDANEDFAGWLYIEGTNIDYPVMYTPEEPEYYLRRSFERNYSRSGVPFIDAQCSLDCNNLVIHGHNMRNGTMFSELLKYDDEDFYNKHKYISFHDVNGENTYQVVSAFYTQIYPDEDGVFRYYDYFGELNSERMREYVQNICALRIYDPKCVVTENDDLLTLSTCAYHVDDGRFVLVAKKIDSSSAVEE